MFASEEGKLMAKARVVSNRLAKAKCKEQLEKVGFTDIKTARKQSCDLVGRKSNKTYYIEIKYSSKEAGSYFGTVMLTEMFQAIRNWVAIIWALKLASTIWENF